KIAHKYNTLAPNLTENWTSTLGMTGAFGLSLLLLALFMDLRKKQFVKNLSKLNLAALLIGTIGGFGSMFALLISPSIRALNRISVFISAFAFICVAYLVSGLSRRMPKIPFYGLLVFIGLFGVWEQSNDGLRYNPPVEKFQQDREFFQTLESIAGDAPVYQLPVVDFPDMIPYHNMGEYEQLRGYLFTEKTKWSYGNVAGRYPNAWLQNISFQDSTTDLISMLHKAGFKFIYLNKTGFVDNGNLMISEISAILGKPVAESHDHTLLLFDLNRNKKIHSEKNAGQENLLEMPAYSYGPRILFNSTPRIGEFAKLPLPAEIYLFNPKKNNQAVQILFSIEDLAPREKILSLKHLKQTIMINTENFPVTYKGTLVLPSGRSELKITSSSNSQLIIRGFSIKQIE
ncbi:MAG: hypothetical protein IT569_05260, partial [Leptospiraceae bacterium]|nr:hypothetical protein [Leptospiraceae bacterium]